MRITKIIKQEKAQALVESAIALPLLLVLFFGCMELVHIAIGHIVVREAAFESGRQAYINNNADYAESIAKSICGKISSGATTFDINDQGNGHKTYIVVHHMKPLFPVVPKRVIKYEVPDFLFYSGD